MELERSGTSRELSETLLPDRLVHPVDARLPFSTIVVELGRQIDRSPQKDGARLPRLPAPDQSGSKINARILLFD